MLGLAGHRVALVFGGGGIAGWLFHTGVVDAFERLGWSANDATLVVGTSAGSSVAAMLRLGRSADEMHTAFTYEPTREERSQAFADRKAVPRQWAPLSPGLLAEGLRSGRSGLGLALAGLLPPGRWSSHYLGLADEGFTGPWPDDLWIPAVDVHTADLVVLGRDERPPLSTAISASSALPFLFRPISIDGRCLIDGGVMSPTHATLAAQAAPDVVIVSSPMTRPGVRPFALHARHQLRDELAALRRTGTRVVAVEPGMDAVPAFRSYPRRDRSQADVLRRAGRHAALTALSSGGR